MSHKKRTNNDTTYYSLAPSVCLQFHYTEHVTKSPLRPGRCVLLLPIEETNRDLPPTSSDRKQQDLDPNLSPFDRNENPSSITVQYNGERFPGRCDGKEHDESEGEGRRLRWWINKCLMSMCYTQACCQASAARRPRKPGPPAAPNLGAGPALTCQASQERGQHQGLPSVPHPPLMLTSATLILLCTICLPCSFVKWGQSGAHIINAEVDKGISAAQGTQQVLGDGTEPE